MTKRNIPQGGFLMNGEMGMAVIGGGYGDGVRNIKKRQHCELYSL